MLTGEKTLDYVRSCKDNVELETLLAVLGEENGNLGRYQLPALRSGLLTWGLSPSSSWGTLVWR